MMSLDVLVPTRDRSGALAATLTSLAMQTARPFRVVISDQGDESATSRAEVRTALRVLELHGCLTEVHHHLPRRGMAEQRAFLLSRSSAPRALFLDDDLILEPWVLDVMTNTLTREGCGFVGSAVIGLSYRGDVRPHQQAVELWSGRVTPEVVRVGTPAWERYKLHNAANLLHVQEALGATPLAPVAYKVAWVGGCVLYDREKLLAVGGFDFWRDLPEEHAGEDVLAQLRVMARFGGCGVMPSGAYHQELPTTLPNREVDAPRVLPW
ncbi:glycosyltransferase family 2 protein [Deinococcus yavapaiensis]|uniref:Glycosyl transferase family 2 n=1 Tax=Deinococcus yavapaiensis KR-236 TaxID=694435 RepID=A0A318SD43_9DEIO|nr:glycosyltransferase family A protein [Deinococcus yavapaiensis]PYE49947.1 glycosyl transferase family 2 [Deinococcus yavapaiensis KR-236]